MADLRKNVACPMHGPDILGYVPLCYLCGNSRVVAPEVAALALLLRPPGNACGRTAWILRVFKSNPEFIRPECRKHLQTLDKIYE